MVAALLFGTIIDLAIAGVMVGVSGFVLEGVNNTGPQMPAAVFFVAFILFCIIAPIAAWVLRARAFRPATTLGVAFAPIIIGGAVLLAEPLFAG